MKLKNIFVLFSIIFLLQSNFLSFSMYQEQKEESENPRSARTIYLLKPKTKTPQELERDRKREIDEFHESLVSDSSDTVFRFNNRDLDAETKRNMDEFHASLKQTLSDVLENNRDVVIETLARIVESQRLRSAAQDSVASIVESKELVEKGTNSANIILNGILTNPELMHNSRVFLKGLLSDPELSRALKDVLKDSLRDPEVASAARNFIENANKSILSTRNLFILIWLIPAIKASRDLAPYIVKYLSKPNNDKIQWNKIINNKHSKLLALAVAGVFSSGLQAFITEKIFQGAKLTVLGMIWLTRAILKKI